MFVTKSSDRDVCDNKKEVKVENKSENIAVGNWDNDKDKFVSNINWIKIYVS